MKLISTRPSHATKLVETIVKNIKVISNNNNNSNIIINNSKSCCFRYETLIANKHQQQQRLNPFKSTTTTTSSSSSSSKSFSLDYLNSLLDLKKKRNILNNNSFQVKSKCF